VSPYPPPPWGFYGDVGLNDAEQMYVALKDGTGRVSVVKNPDLNAAIQTTWQEWNIELTEFTSLDFNSVKKIYVGLGDRDYHPLAGGKGIVYFDDIRACPPRCVPQFGKPLADIAGPDGVGDYDCTVDEYDLRVMLDDWLLRDYVASPLMAWYKFDGNADDSSGNGNDGTLVGGATWATGRFGGGIELDGTSGYVSVPGFSLTTDSITFVAWLNGWKANDWAPLISSRVVSACEMHFGTNNTLHYTWNDDSAATYNWTGGPVIPQDTWTMLAVTIDPSSATAYVYTDAGGLTKSTNTIAHIVQTVGALQIGYSYDPRYVRGIIDDVRIYDRALSEAEIISITDGSLGPAADYHPIDSPADLYKGEPQGQQWINFRDFSILADDWLVEKENYYWP